MTAEILGIGNDILEIERLKSSLTRQGSRLLKRLFSSKEQEYCFKYKDPLPHLAGRFAAKEAISKALGEGIGKKISWLDLEILNEGSGKPAVFFSKKWKKKLEGTRLLISISHCSTHASCIAIWTKE